MSAAVATKAVSSQASAVSANFAPTAPASVASGDLLIIFLATTEYTPSPTPTGWTLVKSETGASGMDLHCYSRVADGGANDTPTFVAFNSFQISAALFYRVTGQAASSPVDTSASASNTSASTLNLAAVTTSEANELLLAAAANTIASHTDQPNDWTLESTNTTNQVIYGYSQFASSAGSYGGNSPADKYDLAFARPLANITIAIKSGVSNSPPDITSNGGASTATITANENQTAVTTVVASGTPTPTYSITGGADSGDFSIGSSTGVLTFSAVPDYDVPADSDSDSVYVVEVTATNSEGTDVQTLTVVVNPMRYGATPPAPLNDAEYFYRFLTDHVAGNTQYPNFGTRDEPLILGDSYAADGQDPDWAASSIGNHLAYTNAGDSYAHAVAPQAIIDAADFTVAARVRWNTLGTIGNLFNAIKDISTDTKTIFMHKQSDNTYEGRVWDGTDNSQLAVISTTTGSTSATHSIVLTYSGTTRVLTLYINGSSEDSDTLAHARRLRGSEYYLEWPVGVGLADPTLSPDCKYFRMAFWDRELSSGEVAALETNAHWMLDGKSPPVFRRPTRFFKGR